jgi:hypothetical protein
VPGNGGTWFTLFKLGQRQLRQARSRLMSVALKSLWCWYVMLCSQHSSKELKFQLLVVHFICRERLRQENQARDGRNPLLQAQWEVDCYDWNLRPLLSEFRHHLLIVDALIRSSTD